jgi:hypothetical protein
MNVEIGTEAEQFPEKEYINGIFVGVYSICFSESPVLWRNCIVLCPEFFRVSWTLSAKNQYQKFETNIPRKGMARLQSPFSTVMCLRAIYIFPRSICLLFSAAGNMTDPGNI